MQLNLSLEDRTFQQEVRDFIVANLSPDLRRAQALTPSVFADPDIVAPWHRALYAKGWVAPSWPKQYGGTGWTPTQRWIFDRECAQARVPPLQPQGPKMVGPVIIAFGSDKQKNFYLPRILSGEDIWCQGYSEPGSGSDLASLKTRAVRDGDYYVVNGTKIWTTHAHFANRMFALVRTADTPRKQDGISFILIDMDTPGITIRPIITIGGDHEVNQVFFDDVRVPVENLIGEENKGWTYGKYLLEFERGGNRSSLLRKQLRTIVALGRSEQTGHAVRDSDIALRIAQCAADIDALEMIELQVMSSLQSGQNPGPISSLLKLRSSEIWQAVTHIGVEVIGYDATFWEPIRPLYSLNDDTAIPENELTIVPDYLNKRANTIFGGTSEVQRDIIAKLMLGL
jgi:acyl-CoA dehydrogenase